MEQYNNEVTEKDFILGRILTKGLYFAEVLDGDESKVLRVVKE